MTDHEQELRTAPIPEHTPEPAPTDGLPWKQVMDRVLFGVMLTGITFNLWNLNFILPAIGYLLLLLGFRSLRQEDPWFRACFLLTLLQAVCFYPGLILNTTVYASTVTASPAAYTLMMASLVLRFATYVCLWRGFLAVRQRAGFAPRASGMAALVVWYLLFCLLAFVQYSGFVLALALIIGFFVILRQVWKQSNELEDTQYRVHPAPQKVRDRGIVIALASLLLVGFLCGYGFFGSYPMAWTERDPLEQADVEAVAAHLLSLGFPAEVLEDLTPEDIAACDGALQVVTESITRAEDGQHGQELKLTGVGVQLPGEQDRWMLFHHFLWLTDPGFYGTEGIQLWTAYRDVPAGWISDGELTGRALHDTDGKTLVADYHSLGPQTFTSNTPFWGDQTNTDIFASFSMPRDSQRQRGYLAYPILAAQPDYLVSSWMNYSHQLSWFQYPAKTATEELTSSFWSDGAFAIIQTALQFRPNVEGAELLH